LIYCEDNIKINLREEGYGLDSTGSEQDLIVGY